jgi:hypothetical protein
VIHREDIRRLVREELMRRLASAVPVRARFQSALLEIDTGPECTEDLDFPVRRSCVIEPDRPCYNSGYCKKLGY